MAAEKKKGGCLKGCLVSLGVIFIMVIIGGGLLWFYRGKVISKATKVMETKIVKRLPEGIDKKEVKELFAKARKAIKTGDYDKKKLKAVGRECKKALKDKKLTEEEINKIIKELKEALE